MGNKVNIELPKNGMEDDKLIDLLKDIQTQEMRYYDKHKLSGVLIH